MKLSAIREAPHAGAPDTIVAFLHGYGANGADLIGLSELLRPILPGAVFVAPDAPTVCGRNPAGFEWFDLEGSDSGRRRAAVNASLEAVAALLAELRQEYSLPPARTLLFGFSQGTMMALLAGLAQPEAPMGIVGFSGFLPESSTVSALLKSRPPVCLVHGDADNVVPFELGRSARDTLEALNVPVEFHTSPGAGHTIAPDGLAFAARFLTGLVSAPKR